MMVALASPPPGAPGGTPDPLGGLAGRLGHTFAAPELLATAVTHRSWCAEHPGSPSNERLEFLGDAVLGVVVTDYLYSAYPDLAEGQLAKARASVVSAVTLADVARQVDLGAALRLGRGEDASGGRDKASILADAMEAVLGAVWLDGGLGAVAPIVLGLLGDRVRLAAAGPGGSDFKTRLQERSAQLAGVPPEYRVASTGPDHAKQFEASVFIAGEEWGTGGGRSKKEAEQAAAANAWERLGAASPDAGANDVYRSGPPTGAGADGDDDDPGRGEPDRA